MLSRIADSLFWISRYVERADGILRMLKVNYATSLDQSTSSFSWRPALKTFTSLNDAEIEAIEKNSHDVLYYMIDDKKNSNSIINIIKQSRENARGVQDNLTLEVWEAINGFYHNVNNRQYIKINDPLSSITDLIGDCIAFYGALEITMMRGEGWLYISLGKFLERSLQTADIIESKFNELSADQERTVAIPYWRHLLLSVSGYEIYLRTYRTGVQSRNVIDLMVHNTTYPRSILYSLNHVNQTFRRLRDSVQPDAHKKIEYKIGKVRSKVHYSDVDTICRMGLNGFLRDVKKDLYIICDDLQNLNYSL
jgi:uncharacterized alpha-E superfamily protein